MVATHLIRAAHVFTAFLQTGLTTKSFSYLHAVCWHDEIIESNVSGQFLLAAQSGVICKFDFVATRF